MVTLLIKQISVYNYNIIKILKLKNLLNLSFDRNLTKNELHSFYFLLMEMDNTFYEIVLYQYYMGQDEFNDYQFKKLIKFLHKYSWSYIDINKILQDLNNGLLVSQDFILIEKYLKKKIWTYSRFNKIKKVLNKCNINSDDLKFFKNKKKLKYLIKLKNTEKIIHWNLVNSDWFLLLRFGWDYNGLVFSTLDGNKFIKFYSFNNSYQFLTEKYLKSDFDLSYSIFVDYFWYKLLLSTFLKYLYRKFDIKIIFKRYIRFFLNEYNLLCFSLKILKILNLSKKLVIFLKNINYLQNIILIELFIKFFFKIYFNENILLLNSIHLKKK